MRSYSFYTEVADEQLWSDIYGTIQDLKWYFRKFAKGNADDAMHMALMHSLTHYNPSLGDLNVYIKSLARDITKDNGKVVFVDFMEQTLSGDTNDVSQNTATVNMTGGKVLDFSDTVVDDMVAAYKHREDVVTLALQYMDKFLLMCDSLSCNDTTTSYYPETFVKACLRLVKKYSTFNKDCIDLYFEVGDMMRWFVADIPTEGAEWMEVDYSYISTNTSNRLKLVDPRTGFILGKQNPDDYPTLGVSMRLGSKRVIKVNYKGVWNMLCDMVDDETINQIRFTLDDQYIVRTLGGAWSLPNTSLFNEYGLMRDEIVTNILQDTKGRLLGVGSDNIYILISDEFEIPNRTVRGIPISFTFEDITDDLA